MRNHKKFVDMNNDELRKEIKQMKVFFILPLIAMIIIVFINAVKYPTGMPPIDQLVFMTWLTVIFLYLSLFSGNTMLFLNMLIRINDERDENIMCFKKGDKHDKK